jgi:hypothetical protein
MKIWLQQEQHITITAIFQINLWSYDYKGMLKQRLKLKEATFTVNLTVQTSVYAVSVGRDHLAESQNSGKRRGRW